MSAAHPLRPAVRTHVLIAVKELRNAKSRLGPRLDADQRAALVLAMLRDTLSAALSSDAVAHVTVITPDARVASAARDLGAALFPDSGEGDLNSVLTAAARTIAGPVVALQGDLPCLSATELTEALTAAQPLRRSVIVDHHGTGTAALIATDGDLAPRFGDDSAIHHISSGATALTGHWPGLRLDVDTPDDLDAAVSLGTGPATFDALHEMNVTDSSRCL